MYILDTNTISEIFRYGQQRLLGRRLAAVPNPTLNLRVTVITFGEILGGRIKDLDRDPKKVPHLEPLTVRYSKLLETYDALRDYSPLHFDDAADAIYQKIPKAIKDKAKIRDCRIAAIVVAHDLKVITANVKDFVRIKRAIPVEYEDWSILSLH